MSLVFKAKVSSIVKFEEESNMSLVEALRDVEARSAIAPLFKIAKIFSGASDDELDEYFGNHGFEGTMNAILESLGEGGFLPKETPKTESPQGSSTKIK